MVWHSHLFQNFQQFIGIVNKAEIDVFRNSCFFHDPADVGNLISGSSAFSKTSLNIWKFTVHILLKPGLENFQHTDFFNTGQVIWYSYLFKNFLEFVVIHTVKFFGAVNKAEVDVFLEISCFFCDPADVKSKECLKFVKILLDPLP